VWTYAFEPKAQPPDGWLIRSYVENDFQQFMQASLAAMGRRTFADLPPALQ
jgi:hypothetical protein